MEERGFDSSSVVAKETREQLIVECPHGGTQGLLLSHGERNPLFWQEGDIAKLRQSDLPPLLRENVRSMVSKVMRTIRIGVDIAAPQIAGIEEVDPKKQHIRIIVPRAFIDVNREKNQYGPLAAEGGEKPDASGLIWTGTVEDSQNPSQDMLVRPYTQAELNTILEKTYNSYHQQLREMADKAVSENGGVVVLGVHTMPDHLLGKVREGRHFGAYKIGPNAKRGSIDLANGVLPDVILISNNGKSCSPQVMQLVKKTFDEFGILYVDGFGPFVGDTGITSESMYGRPRDGYNALGMEFVAHNGLEPGRIEGSLFVGKERAMELNHVMEILYERIMNLEKESLKS